MNPWTIATWGICIAIAVLVVGLAASLVLSSILSVVRNHRRELAGAVDPDDR